jgi:hypothetical protein
MRLQGTPKTVALRLVVLRKEKATTMAIRYSSDTKRYPDNDREFKAAIHSALPSFILEQRPLKGLSFGIVTSISVGALLGVCVGKSGLISPVINGAIIGCVVGSMMELTGHFIENKWRWYSVVIALMGYMLASVVGTLLLSNAYTESVSITIAKRPLIGPIFDLGYLGMTPLDIVGFAFAGSLSYHFAKRRITRGHFIKREHRGHRNNGTREEVEVSFVMDSLESPRYGWTYSLTTSPEPAPCLSGGE